MSDKLSTVEMLNDFRADFQAATASRLSRSRPGIPSMGAGADYHYRSESQYLRLMEYARDLDRNDIIVGQCVDRAVDNEIQCGFSIAFKTGDTKLDNALEARWTEEAADPAAIDETGEYTFYDMEWLTSRSAKVDGDVFVLLTNSGRAQIIEGHRCRSPYRSTKRIIHGVEKAGLTSENVAYWFTKHELEPHYPKSSLRVRDLQRSPRFDSEGYLATLQLLNRKRASQTRGVTAFAPIFDAVSMHDDIQFATLLQRQVVSCFAIFKQRQMEWTADSAKKAASSEIAIRPGMIYEGDPGETLHGFSPSVPSMEFFPHVKLILTFIGINLGLPLVMVLMDGSETNFSGWRGSIDQARIGFRRNQKARVSRFYNPFTKHRIRVWADDDAALRAAIANRSRDGVDPFRFVWTPPAWPYIQPVEDATGDLIREQNGQISPRRRAQERGYSYTDLVEEIVEDRATLIEKAIERADAINAKYNLEGDRAVHWERLAPLPTSDGMSISATLNNGQGQTNVNPN